MGNNSGASAGSVALAFFEWSVIRSRDCRDIGPLRLVENLVSESPVMLGSEVTTFEI